ncbi:carboxypeptidase-like regulatory domain-containing protein [Paenibacillus hexagrammi]|uniref:Carboxypeptidase-like regulatory domain-containing protein n=1 Tax=Paenibacillus hexagrammi TaxID=2908839 RepID=A0ABY3SRD9_9BACL|nr:carboxypeptidase-like regulatory domain-containing protein [Paenibacillus sp. YPD9-1]UJF36043.1 carboxypeptidase-like regulatory domain-containing protein [Paenibacillus sp. YPD9-1]
MKVFRSLACTLLVSLLFFTSVGRLPTAYATATKASVELTVLSTNEYPISYANVVLTSNVLPFPVNVKTDSSGEAVYPNLPEGTYSISITATGFGESSPIVTGTLSAGQTFTQTVHMTPNNALIGIDSLNAYNNLMDPAKFDGTVTWSTYGDIPDQLDMQLQFLDAADNPIGSIIETKYTEADTNYYSSTLTQVSVPSGASRIGVTILDSGSAVIARRSIPLWIDSSHAAQAVRFHDSNANGGLIDASITWTGATDEDALAGYNVYYWVTEQNTWNYWDSVSKRADKTYQYTFGALPPGTSALLIGSLNAGGEELPSHPTAYVIDNRLSDSVLTAPTSSVLPAPSNIQDYTYSPEINKLSGQIGFTLPSDQSAIQGYTLYFADDNGDKIQAIGTIYTPRELPQLFYDLDAMQPVPSGATQFALTSYGKDGSESSAVYAPLKQPQMPSNIKFIDLDERPNQLHGFLTWSTAQDESNLSSYSIYFLDDSKQTVSLIGEVSKGNTPIITLPWDLAIPNTATRIGIGINDAANNLSSTFSSFPITDHVSHEEITAAVKAAYFPGSERIDVGNIVTFLQQSPDLSDQRDLQLFLSLIQPIAVHSVTQ